MSSRAPTNRPSLMRDASSKVASLTFANPQMMEAEEAEEDEEEEEEI